MEKACRSVRLLLTAEACALGFCHNTGVHTVDTDVVRMTVAVVIEGTVYCLALYIQLRFRLADGISGASLLLKAGAARLVGHGCLAAVHQNVVLGTLPVRIIHAVCNITIH